MSREPTKHQLSSRLSYQQHTPAFLRKLQKNYGGGRRGDDDDEEDEPTYGDGEFEDDGSGRPPIPVRPSIPKRPKDNPGSGDEDGDDEKPQVVVLKEGKHLTEREVQNEKRKAQGLPPLSEPSNDSKVDPVPAKTKPKATNPKSLNFSSTGSSTTGSVAKKRKAVVDLQLQDEDFASLGDVVKDIGKGSKPAKKKPKRTDKKLLSFGDDA
ncbi:hypothetical protein BDM02DRAFT_3187607 [Thelephora ganbajun]|uniref:Uncharacterized protein n=1 Tax=Thelephora ganbajun TaxID=370292 RepID=A0ACB6ZEA7_THEGA|nr:hypothetical protein BDM02DRAFT_3187607 [Thelephora ganbajun]